MYDHISVAVEEGIATITLDRADKLNAYTVWMGEEIVDAFDTLREADDVGAIIITGAGRGFCAGVDLDHLEAQTSGQLPEGTPRLGEERLVRELPLTLVEYPKPVIAAINGHAIGVGITMVLACDLRIAAEGAKIALPFVKMGILPGLGSTYLLRQLVGPAKARELVLTSRTLLADEAVALGIVNECVPGGQLMQRARALARDMLEAQPAALAAAKRLLNADDAAQVERAMRRERAASDQLRKQ